MKARFAASLIAASMLALGAAATHAEEDPDPVTRQLNRWGVAPTPENIARFHAENSGGAVPFGYYPYSAYQMGPGYVYNNGSPVYLGVPPAGYQWQQYDGSNYALINQITGAIAQILRVR